MHTLLHNLSHLIGITKLFSDKAKCLSIFSKPDRRMQIGKKTTLNSMSWTN